MKKKNLTLKDTFLTALENYKKRKFLESETICNKILIIDPYHFDSIVLLSNIFAIKSNFVKAKELLTKANEMQPNNLIVINDYLKKSFCNIYINNNYGIDNEKFNIKTTKLLLKSVISALL